MQVRSDKYKQVESGFTLVEVLVGMTLMAMVFTAAFGTYFLGMRLVEDAREELRASQIIQSELEAMRTMNWNDMEYLASLNWAQFTPRGDYINKFSKNYYCYRWVSDDAQKKRVIIYVYWINSKGLTSIRMFNSIFTKNGINDYYYRKV